VPRPADNGFDTYSPRLPRAARCQRKVRIVKGAPARRVLAAGTTLKQAGKER